MHAGYIDLEAQSQCNQVTIDKHLSCCSIFLLTFLHLLYTLYGHLNGFDEVALIEIHAVNTGLTMVSISFCQWASVVHDVPPVFAIVLNDGVMAYFPCDFVILSENLSYAFEGTER